MKKFFANIWTKRVASLISGFYAFVVCYLCYCSVFYNIHISSNLSLCLLVTGVSIFTLVIMLYSRKQIITRIASFLILPAMLPVVLMYFGSWHLIIPIIVTGIIILLLSGAGEGAKTAFGTIFLLMYIFGALGYFLMTSLFATSSKTDTIASGISPSQQYRYTVVNTEDTSNGSTSVYVEPNNADISYPYVTFTIKNLQRVVYLERPIAENVDVQWTTQSRQEITSYLNSISDTIVVHLSESQLEKLGYTYDNKLALVDLTTEQKNAVGKTASDIDRVYLDALTVEQLAYFGIGKNETGKYYVLSPSAALLEELEKASGERVYFNELNGDQQYDFSVEKDDSIYLNSLSDANLAMLGVPESGDVMSFNGKVCFRYYIAVLENYFDVDDRSLSISLLS